MKNFVIIHTPKGYKYSSMVADEIVSSGYNCFLTTITAVEKLLKEKNLTPNNTVIHTRTAHPGYVYQLLKKLAGKGYKIYNNPETVKLTSQKYLSCVHMEKHHLPCAETIKVKRSEAINKVKELLGQWSKVIVKPLTSKGQGEYAFCFSQKNLDELGDIQTIPADEVIIQKYVSYTRLSRVIVVGFKALEGAVFYDEPGNGWKCSVCLNPAIKIYHNPPKELLELAEKSARAFNGEVFFIDIFSTPDGFVLNEINTACSLILHQKISGVNIAQFFAQRLIKLSKE